MPRSRPRGAHGKGAACSGLERRAKRLRRTFWQDEFAWLRRSLTHLILQSSSATAIARGLAIWWLAAFWLSGVGLIIYDGAAAQDAIKPNNRLCAALGGVGRIALPPTLRSGASEDNPSPDAAQTRKFPGGTTATAPSSIASSRSPRRRAIRPFAPASIPPTRFCPSCIWRCRRSGSPMAITRWAGGRAVFCGCRSPWAGPCRSWRSPGSPVWSRATEALRTCPSSARY